MSTENIGVNVLDEIINMNNLVPEGDKTVESGPAPAMKAKELSPYQKLNAESKEKVDKVLSTVDFNDMNSLSNFGLAAQSKIGDFSNKLLDNVSAKDTGPAGDVLTELMEKLHEANPEELVADQNIFKRIFSKINKNIFEITSKYQKMGAQIDLISKKLQNEKKVLDDDVLLLESLYQENKQYHEALNIYIAAGEEKLREFDEEYLPNELKKAEESGDQMQVQAVNDLKDFRNRFDKRIYDLKTVRAVTIQQAPQIRLIQNVNQTLSDKISASISTAIPLWKNQVAIALTLLRQKNAITAQRQVSETTNDLLAKNSEMLKISAIETAEENERGIVDIETLQKTQNDLIETIQATLQIQKEGKEKRVAAELELNKMEEDLKVKLLDSINEGSNKKLVS